MCAHCACLQMANKNITKNYVNAKKCVCCCRQFYAVFCVFQRLTFIAEKKKAEISSYKNINLTRCASVNRYFIGRKKIQPFN